MAKFLEGLLRPSATVIQQQQQLVLHKLQSNDRSVQILDCGPDVDDDFLFDVCKQLATNRTVTTLRIRGKNISGGSVLDHLAMITTQNHTLVHVKLSAVGLTDTDVACLMGGMLRNRSIRTLCLENNSITTVLPACRLLQHNRVLEVLDLSGNDIGVGKDDGNSPPHQLGLGAGVPRDESSMADFAAALRGNGSLRQLFLSRNQLRDKDVHHFVTLVCDFGSETNIRVIDVDGNPRVTEETRRALRVALLSKVPFLPVAAAVLKESSGTGLQSSSSFAMPPPSPRGTSGITGAGVSVSEAASLSDEDVALWQAKVEEARRNEAEALTAAGLARDTAEQQRRVHAEQLQARQVMIDRNERAAASALDAVQRLTAERERCLRDVETLRTEVTAQRATIETLTGEIAEVGRELVQCYNDRDAEVTRLMQSLHAANATIASLEAEKCGLSTSVNVLTQLLSGARGDNAASQMHWAHARMVVPAATQTAPWQVTPVDGTSASARRSTSSSRSSESPQATPTGKALERPRRGSTAASGPQPSPVAASLSHRVPAAAAPLIGKKDRSLWVRDKDVENCRACRKKFSALVRRHHCRSCGDIFCSRCCANSSLHGMRVCVQCTAA